jgi:dTDP-4-dehydrorhamnose 3,5-epimerase|tara:strand:+ start:508 stop:1035 length:528 start_codon:yes stop_codon:yes gene_type:complete
MKTLKTNFKGLEIFESQNIFDNRGYFREVFIKKKFKNDLIFTVASKSNKNVLRGLHMQVKKQQGKYVSVVKGKILDVCVDCRTNSKSFGKNYKIILSEKNGKSIYIPPGFIHGFLGLEKENIVVYGCTNYRDKDSEMGVIWNDADLKIKWPIKKPIISDKDKNNISFKEFKKLKI